MSFLHNILIIGCGSIGERHLRCFLKTNRGKITACDTNSTLLDNIYSKYGTAVEADWTQALQSGKYSAAVICTPAPLHVPMGLSALGQKMHVLIEKPLSHSLDQVQELLQSSKTSHCVTAVAYVLHQFPVLHAARHLIETGELGQILQVSTMSGQPFHRLRPDYVRSYYRAHSTGGGAIQDALTHSVNWVESVVGPTDSVLCDTAHLALPGVEVEDTVHVNTRNGRVLVSYCLNQFQSPTENFIQLNAERGSIRIELHKQRWGVWREGESDWTWHPAPVPDRDSHFTSQANAFLDKIEGKPANLCSLEAAAQTLRFNLAALASAKTNQRVYCRDLNNLHS